MTRVFFAINTLLILTSDTMTLFIMASGCTFVILMGGIDLSLQAVASMTSVILAICLPEYGYLAILIALAGGFDAGVLSGVSHTVLRVPSFIATLAVGGIVATAALVFSDTRSVNIAAETRDVYLSWITGESFGIPNEIYIGFLVLVGLRLILKLTPFGRFTASIGAAERAVYASGINVNRIKLYRLYHFRCYGRTIRNSHGRAHIEWLTDLSKRVFITGYCRHHRWWEQR